MSQSRPRALPRFAVAPGLDLDDGDGRPRRPREVLVLAELPSTVRGRMKRRGARLTDVPDVDAALAALAERDFEAFIVDLEAPDRKGLVVRLKGGVSQLEADAPAPDSSAEARRARQRHRLTPFYLVMAGEQQYAIVVDPPEHAYLEDGEGLGLADAVMCLDVRALLLRGPALA